VDEPLVDGQLLRLGDADWEAIATPGRTAGHLSLWQPDERLLVVGDTLSDYDVGWVNLALDGPVPRPPSPPCNGWRTCDLASCCPATARSRRTRVLPSPLAPAGHRLVDDPDGAVWYGARRIFAYALMIRDGCPSTRSRSTSAPPSGIPLRRLRNGGGKG
jgi:hypothetical protein